MNRNSGFKKSFLVIYPDTNTVEFKYFNNPCLSLSPSLDHPETPKHSEQLAIDTAMCSEVEEIEPMEFIPFELPF